MRYTGSREPENQETNRQGQLPERYSARAPRREELDEVVALIAACELADEGNVEVERDDVRGGW